MRHTGAFLATLVISGAASWAAAQSGPAASDALPEPPTFQIPAGAKVRVASSAIPGGTVEGRVVSSTDEALALMLGADDAPFGGGQVVIPRASLTSVKVSMGRRGHALHGAVLGALLGAAGGAAAEVDPQDCDSSSDAFCSQGEAIAVSAAGGALLGALVGAVVKTEKWQKVSVEVLAPRSATGRSGVRPVGVAAQVAFRF